MLVADDAHSPRRLAVVPVVAIAFQVRPSVVCTIDPPLPAAQTLVGESPKIASQPPDGPVCSLVYEVPPFIVRRIVPAAPTMVSDVPGLFEPASSWLDVPLVWPA